MNQDDYIQMWCEEPTRTRLNTYGIKGETYDVLLTRLMDFHDKHNKKVRT